MCGGIPQKCGSGINNRCWHEGSKRGSFKLLSLVEPPCMLNWWAPCFGFFRVHFDFYKILSENTTIFSSNMQQFKLKTTIPLIACLCWPWFSINSLLIGKKAGSESMKTFRAHTAGLCECDVFINLMTPVPARRWNLEIYGICKILKIYGPWDLGCSLAVNDATTRRGSQRFSTRGSTTMNYERCSDLVSPHWLIWSF